MKSHTDVRRSFKQLLQALAYLHQLQIVHRDVKPENCLFQDERQEHLKLIDFGFAVVRKLDDKKDSFLQDLVGTPKYMSPEMIASSRGTGYGEQTDVWSAGIILSNSLLAYRWAVEIYSKTITVNKASQQNEKVKKNS